MRALSIDEQIQRWRAHPNYRKTCKCGHPSILHSGGTGRCGHVNPEQESDCDCRHFQSANAEKSQPTNEIRKERQKHRKWNPASL